MADSRYDIVVIGAGHNGLTAAALLAKKGRRVLVLERRDVTGGLCAGEEFHPGYHTAGVLQDTVSVRPGVVDALRLRDHGLEFDSAQAMLLAERDGSGILLSHAPGEAENEIAQHSSKDARSYREFRRFIDRVRPVVEPVLNQVPPDIGSLGGGSMIELARKGLALRALGSRDMMQLLRIPPMCVADWMREWFETERLCAGLAAPAIIGTWCGPWSPGTAANLLMRECTAGPPVKGGAASLAAALENAARAAGVEIRTGTNVECIRAEEGRATGVVLAGAEEIGADVVVSSCDPKTTFLDLFAPGDLPDTLVTRITKYRARGTTAKVHLALNRPLSLAGRPDLKVEYARTCEALDDQERAFDAVKYRRFSERPMLDIHVTNVSQPDRAPDGHASLSILVHFAPYQLEGGWTDDARERLGDAVVAELERYAPGTSSSIVAREVLTPADIEARYGTTGGHVHHGEHALDQLITRPTPEAARYTTPVSGLYLCGSGSHPGGGITCAPGALCARILTS